MLVTVDDLEGDWTSCALVRAAEQLDWSAFRQLNLSTPDSPRDHQVFVQEFLTAADPAETVATYDALRDGITACAEVKAMFDRHVVDDILTRIDRKLP